MKRKIGLTAFILTFVLLTACNKEESVPTDAEVPLPIAVDLTVAEEVAVNEKVVMEAVVTQGDEKVEDASEVVFEVWEEGNKTASEMIESSNEKDGLYRAETTFDHDGLFTIQVHVTARDMHVMPKTLVTVGEGASEEHADTNEVEDHGHSEGFSMEFMNPEKIDSDEETKLLVHLKMGDKSFEKAEVRYEIWSDNSDKHDWVDADELLPGEYTANYTFMESGTYHIQVHVEDDTGLHEHEEHKVDVEK